ncbi:ATP-dependent helicase [Thioalkalivibrio sp. HK1]|uniref:ATP-dependent helicase n=1 Tax=Thioalkalivibrio sp. HK1 TaxID=1469245 RepID=UPI00046E7EDC|nr:ATP-dependent helicase [Thioalkalivibrio sp. HK1]
MSEFDTALDTLSKSQRCAVNWQDGALLVLAGPGSGKTRTLILRIARLLLDTPDRRFCVLGLTFTNRAADEMRQRLLELNPELEDRLFIGTFHSFCVDVLRQDGLHVGIKSDFRIYSLDRDREHILQRCLQSAVPNDERQLLRRYKILRYIDRLHEHLIPPTSAYDHLLQEGTSEDGSKALAHAYEAYHEGMKSNNAVDFSSLIFFTYTLFSTYPKLAERYQRVYPYWCVDEFQDTNEAQYRLIARMATGGFRNVFAVADDDQIIYQWNGADYRRLEQFQKDFSADRIQLPANYRCPGGVVRLANHLITNNSHRSSDKQELISMKDEGEREHDEGPIDSYELLRFDSDDDEFRGVASRIADIRASSTPTIAVLGRSRALLEGVKEELDRGGIPSFIAQRRDEFESPAFRFIDAALHQSLSRGDERFVEDLVGAFSAAVDREVTLELEDVLVAAQAEHGDYLRGWFQQMMLQPLSQEAKALVQCVKSTLIDSIDYRTFVNEAMDFFESACIDSPDDPLPKYEEDKKAWEAIETEIHQALGENPSLDMFLQELELRSKEPPPAKDAVALMTIHSAKGNEFHTVFLIGLAEEVLPSWQSLKKGDESPELEEERRNCFVAITRAENHLVLSYARRYRGREKNSSRFLKEMGVIPYSLL